MRRVNFLTDTEAQEHGTPEGYLCRSVKATAALGASELSAQFFELPSGQSMCPYHYEYVEEWLVVIEGEVLVRTPDGEETLSAGDTVVFEPGPGGAHKVTNVRDATARALMFSSARVPAVAVYPDSDKIGIWTDNPPDDFMIRRPDAPVEYFDGEG